MQSPETFKSWMVNTCHVQVWWVHWASLVSEVTDKCQRDNSALPGFLAQSSQRTFYTGWNKIFFLESCLISFSRPASQFTSPVEIPLYQIAAASWKLHLQAVMLLSKTLRCLSLLIPTCKHLYNINHFRSLRDCTS